MLERKMLREKNRTKIRLNWNLVGFVLVLACVLDLQFGNVISSTLTLTSEMFRVNLAAFIGMFEEAMLRRLDISIY